MKTRYHLRRNHACGIRLFFGLLFSSAFASLIFHILSEILSTNLLGETEISTNFSLRAFIGIWIFEMLFVFLIAVCVGMPLLWLSRRLGLANVFTASGAGLMLGLIVSIFYGGVDIRSLDSIFFAVAVFGVPGLIGGFTFWAAINGDLKSEIQNSQKS